MSVGGSGRILERRILSEHKKRAMKREELVGWLEEVTRQLKTGTLMIDGEKVALPDEVSSGIKTKNKKGRNSLKLELRWETASRARKKDEKPVEAARDEAATAEGADRKEGKKPAAMVRDYDSHVLVCTGGDCKKRGAKEARKAIKDEVRAEGLLGDVRIDDTSCLGLCKHGPNVVVYDGTEPRGTWYLGLRKPNVPEVVEQHLKGGEPVQRLAADRRPRKARR